VRRIGSRQGGGGSTSGPDGGSTSSGDVSRKAPGWEKSRAVVVSWLVLPRRSITPMSSRAPKSATKAPAALPKKV
jgi:hypothetical protein